MTLRDEQVAAADAAVGRQGGKDGLASTVRIDEHTRAFEHANRREGVNDVYDIR